MNAGRLCVKVDASVLELGAASVVLLIEVAVADLLLAAGVVPLYLCPGAVPLLLATTDVVTLVGRRIGTEASVRDDEDGFFAAAPNAATFLATTGGRETELVTDNVRVVREAALLVVEDTVARFSVEPGGFARKGRFLSGAGSDREGVGRSGLSSSVIIIRV